MKGFKQYIKEEQKQTVIIITSPSEKDVLENIDRISNEEHLLANKAKNRGADSHILFWNKLYFEKTKDNKIMILNNRLETPEKIIISPSKTKVLLRQGIHNSISQAFYDFLIENKIPVINSSESMDNCSNKYKSSNLLSKYNIPTPKYAIISDEKSIDNALEKIGNKFPIIIKSLDRGSTGKGVVKVDTKENLLSVLQALWLGQAPTEILIQEYMEIDGDVRTFIVDGKIVGAMKRFKIGNDFRSNATLGAKIKNYKLSDIEKDITLMANTIMKTDYSGVDHIVYKGKPYILEVNSCPGFKALERAGVKNASDILIDYVLSL